MMKDAFFDKKRKHPGARRHDIREPAPESFLIVTEGTKTEPYYFTGLKQHIEKLYRAGQITVRPSIESKGLGRGTGRLLEEAERWIAYGNRRYQHVWLVFDRDEFDDFDQAVRDTERQGYRAAWSNRCFELWLCLHFDFCGSALSAAEWSARLQKKLGPDFALDDQKTDRAAALFEVLSRDGGLARAMRHAAKLEQQAEGKTPAACDPGTTVHHLIEELRPYLGDLLPQP